MLGTNDLVWPVFICEGNNIKDEIQSMPNVFRYSIDNLNEVYDIASEHRINLIAVFPFTPQELKTKYGDEALNPDNLVCRSLEKLKNHKSDFGIMCDVALDPYTSHGHDGLIKHNKIMNDETIEILINQSLLSSIYSFISNFLRNHWPSSQRISPLSLS